MSQLWAKMMKVVSFRFDVPAANNFPRGKKRLGPENCGARCFNSSSCNRSNNRSYLEEFFLLEYFSSPFIKVQSRPKSVTKWTFLRRGSFICCSSQPAPTLSMKSCQITSSEIAPGSTCWKRRRQKSINVTRGWRIWAAKITLLRNKVKWKN